MPSPIFILFFLAWILVYFHLKRNGHGRFLGNGIGILAGFCSVFLWFLFSSLTLVDRANESANDAISTPTTAAIDSHVDDDGVLTAQQYWLEYQANEVAADLKFRSKPVTIKGEVLSIRKGTFGGIFVDLATSSERNNVSASFEKELESFVAKLSKGDKVVLSCVGNGLSFGAPTLRNCTSE